MWELVNTWVFKSWQFIKLRITQSLDTCVSVWISLVRKIYCVHLCENQSTSLHDQHATFQVIPSPVWGHYTSSGDLGSTRQRASIGLGRLYKFQQFSDSVTTSSVRLREKLSRHLYKSHRMHIYFKTYVTHGLEPWTFRLLDERANQLRHVTMGDDVWIGEYMRVWILPVHQVTHFQSLDTCVSVWITLVCTI